MSHWSDRLAPGDLNACAPAREWCATQPSWAEAWAACERADWLLWCQRWTDLGGPWDRRRVPLLLCLAEILDLRQTPHRVRVAVALRAWCTEDSEVTRAEVSAARRSDADASAFYAAAAAYDAADASAFYAAAAARHSAYADADASAFYAAAAAYDAAYDADAADADAARHSAHLQVCAIVRRHFPAPPVLGGAA